MGKFIRGYTYIVGGHRRSFKYLVQQTGLKSWRAMVVSHVNPTWELTLLEGNATTLHEKLQKMFAEDFECRRYNANSMLRKDMFNILQYGKFDE